jgi:hypothetical protein
MSDQQCLGKVGHVTKEVMCNPARTPVELWRGEPIMGEKRLAQTNFKSP